ncbi:MAG: patatin-like phospholipase family protein [Bacteroidetes bacterium]|nr:patatin-like phospholipase family protein [Bacteroidota bacterium]
MISSKVRQRFFYSFPIQLLIVLLKKNHLLLLYWIILFGWVTNSSSQTFGIPYLFLDPEYMGSVGFTSFLIIGFATGSFIMVFNISSYIMNGFRFPFIATLSRPFLKYTVNNFIVPALFVLTYMINIIYFQINNEYQGVWNIFSQILGFLIGLALMIMVTLTYFFRTNKDVILMFGMESSDSDPNAPFAKHIRDDDGGMRRKAFSRSQSNERAWRVDTYLSNPYKVKLVRETGHYSAEMVESVFRQNHLNAAIVEIIVFAFFILMGLFKDYSLFKIPAGASVILIFSMFIMLSSAFRFWLKAWSTSVLILFILIINFISQYGVFYSDNKAYGMEYNKGRSKYSIDAFNKNSNPDIVKSDYDSTIVLLEKWKDKFITKKEKPKMIFINCSGGGLRASIWAFRIMEMADSLTNNDFINSTQLISGASGGMIGAAYYRELYLQKRLGIHQKVSNTKSITNVGKDLLNPIAFSITVSDLFFNIQKFKEGETKFNKDRAYAFEQQLNENTGYVLSKPLSSYKEAEASGLIPMMIFSPTIVNDGRRLLISPQHVSYLTDHAADSSFNFETTIDEIEFQRLYKDQRANNIRFTSVLRMNATFPYILPPVSLPSEPVTYVMDAGIRDNTGLKTSLRFLYVFRKWIEENTSGVIFVDIRDSHKSRPIENKPQQTIIQNFFAPLGNIYNNLLTIQDYNQDEAYEYAKGWFGSQFDFIKFELPTKEQDISLSWHLTTREKVSVANSVFLKENAMAFDTLLKKMSDLQPREMRKAYYNLEEEEE